MPLVLRTFGLAPGGAAHGQYGQVDLLRYGPPRQLDDGSLHAGILKMLAAAGTPVVPAICMEAILHEVAPAIAVALGTYVTHFVAVGPCVRALALVCPNVGVGWRHLDPAAADEAARALDCASDPHVSILGGLFLRLGATQIKPEHAASGPITATRQRRARPIWRP